MLRWRIEPSPTQASEAVYGVHCATTALQAAFGHVHAQLAATKALELLHMGQMCYLFAISSGKASTNENATKIKMMQDARMARIDLTSNNYSQRSSTTDLRDTISSEGCSDLT